ncbi:MAG: hypothetical protein GF307_08190, partial [candidate division Zixibacteria bacterium]|nr:hypothetical protein [candidate division Zixibacteria bacterium]
MKRTVLIISVLIIFFFESGTAEIEPLPGFPRTFVDHPYLGTGLGGIVLADLDSDHYQEIVFGCYNKIYVLKHDGSCYEGWPQTFGSYTPGQPSVGDIDGDGELEIAGSIIMPQPNASKLFVWNPDGSIIFYKEFPNNPHLPVFYDLDADNKCELLVCNYHESLLYIFDGNGENFDGWPREYHPIKGSPAIGDINNDNELEIIFISDPDSTNSLIQCVHIDGSNCDGFPYLITAPVGRAIAHSHSDGISLVDMDSDGYQELLFKYSFRTEDFAFINQKWILKHNGIPMTYWPITEDGDFNFAPVAADIIEGDGYEYAAGHYLGRKYLLYNSYGELLPGWPTFPPRGGPFT